MNFRRSFSTFAIALFVMLIATTIVFAQTATISVYAPPPGQQQQINEATDVVPIFFMKSSTGGFPGFELHSVRVNLDAATNAPVGVAGVVAISGNAIDIAGVGTVIQYGYDGTFVITGIGGGDYTALFDNGTVGDGTDDVNLTSSTTPDGGSTNIDFADGNGVTFLTVVTTDGAYGPGSLGNTQVTVVSSSAGFAVGVATVPFAGVSLFSTVILEVDVGFPADVTAADFPTGAKVVVSVPVAADFGITKDNNASTPTIDLDPNATGTDVGDVTVDLVADASLGSGGGQPLAVELASFAGQSSDEGIVLNWRTESETDNLGFNVYRQIGDQEFMRIGFVEGHGSTAVAHDYSFIDVLADEGETYNYFIEDIGLEGDVSRSEIITISFLPPTVARLIPSMFKLYQNYPNPFNPETWLPFDLPETREVSITIYNSIGSPVRSLTLGLKDAGSYIGKSDAAYWDGRNEIGETVGSGLYFYRIVAGEYTAIKRMVILK